MGQPKGEENLQLIRVEDGGGARPAYRNLPGYQGISH